MGWQIKVLAAKLDLSLSPRTPRGQRGFLEEVAFVLRAEGRWQKDLLKRCFFSSASG